MTLNPTNLSSKKVFFPSLDFLRFVAFMLVLNDHAFGDAFAYFSVNAGLTGFVNFICNGGIGVSFFFVLSGYLITYLIIAEKEENGKFNIKAFYVRRILRIWPLYFLCVVFAFLIYPLIKRAIGIETVIAYNPLYFVTFLSNFNHIHVLNVDPTHSMLMLAITWSVSIEEQFYILYPLIFFFVPKKYYKYFLFGIIIISTVFRAYHLGNKNQLYFNSLSVMSDLAMGGLAAYYSIYSQSFLKFFEGLSKYIILVVYILGLLFLMYFTTFFDSIYTQVYFRLITGCFFAFCILEQNFNKAAFKFSRFKLLSNIGKMTYGLYLLHAVAMQLVTILVKVLHIELNTFLKNFIFGVATLTLALIISYLSYNYYEKYFLNLKKKFSQLR